MNMAFIAGNYLIEINVAVSAKCSEKVIASFIYRIEKFTAADGVCFEGDLHVKLKQEKFNFDSFFFKFLSHIGFYFCDFKMYSSLVPIQYTKCRMSISFA